MRGSITIAGASVDLNSDTGQAFVTDACRSAEGVLCDADLVTIYLVDPAELIALSKNTEFARALRAERERRVRSGIAARELASKHFIKAPNVLDSIMSDIEANARHRIESAKELRQIAMPESNAPAANSEKFIITINMGDSVERYEESRAVNVNSPELPKVIDNEPPKLIDASTPKRGRGRPKLKVIEQDSENSDER